MRRHLLQERVFRLGPVSFDYSLAAVPLPFFRFYFGEIEDDALGFSVGVASYWGEPIASLGVITTYRVRRPRAQRLCNWLAELTS